MNDVPTKDRELVVNSLLMFHNEAIRLNDFNLANFVGLMEEKFTEAGYRAQQIVNRSNGGGVT